MNKSDVRMQRGIWRQRKCERRGGVKKKREEIAFKPLISCGQTPSLCQGETQSEGQGLAVPLQFAAEPEV